jgi:hypothetical protein
MEIVTGTKFGRLEVLGSVTNLYRCGCMKCGSDSVLATDELLTSGRVTQCFDCQRQADMTPEQKTVIAFRRSLGMSPEPLPIGWVA